VFSGYWKDRAKTLRHEIHALYLCSRHPGTPVLAKLLAAIIIAYALSPIDLIPDFVPVLGYLDDLLLIPAGIALLIKLIPNEVLNECRERVRENPAGKKMKSWMGAAMIVCVWIITLFLFFWLIFRLAR
jgi:uncharacterized membrane protein YkvA (DUF1232 family)